jgi:hypothetical protein
MQAIATLLASALQAVAGPAAYQEEGPLGPVVLLWLQRVFKENRKVLKFKNSEFETGE